MSDNNNKILLIVAYSERNLGIRYIANYLKQHGFEPTIIFFKEFKTLYDSIHITEAELSLLRQHIESENYLFVGLNIHSSSIIKEIDELINTLNIELDIPFILGGAYPTLLPQLCAKRCDMVLRGEGEISVLQLAKAIQNNEDWKNIPSGCYYNDKNEYIENDVIEPVKDLDSIAYPLIGNDRMFLIEYNNIINIDPQLTTDFYELSASRGCPFMCSYCCTKNIADIYKGKGSFLRYRSVDSVIQELIEAKNKNPNLKEIRFWDEVFPTNHEWVQEFCEKFKQYIGLKFHIFAHPSLINDKIIKMLMDAGLYVIAVGFQSGSPNIRNNIFRRPETNEQIIQSSKILSANKVPKIYYDLMICHPLETLDELKETFELCLQLEPPFNLQIHGLGILPGADIIATLLERNIYTEEELHKITTSTFNNQNKLLLGALRSYFSGDKRKKIWANLIFLTQFPELRDIIIELAKNPYKNKNKNKIEKIMVQKKEKHLYLGTKIFCDTDDIYSKQHYFWEHTKKTVFQFFSSRKG